MAGKRKNHIRKIKSVILTLCLLSVFVLSGCGKKNETKLVDLTPASESTGTKEETVPKTEDELIEEIIAYYGCYGDEADEKVDALLADLSALDEEKGDLWREIMDYWKYANTDLVVNDEKLPDDLPDDNSLCIVVLGFELNADGTMQDELIGRLTVALECAKQYPNAYVVCTGGGTAAQNPSVTEGGLMGEWMLEHGLEESRLIVEDQSMTTAENARNSYRILLNDYPQVNSVVLVSSSYHIPWGAVLFEASFLKTASEQQTPEMHVISNCGYPIENDIYLRSDLLRWETGGMFQLIGNNEKAMQFYYAYNSIEKPPL